MTTGNHQLSSDALDALTELVNIGVGRAAASLSELVGERIELSVPQVRLCSSQATEEADELSDETMSTVVMQDFQGTISGRAALTFPSPSAVALGSLLTGDDSTSTEVDHEIKGVLLEVGNIVLNGVLGSLSNLTGDSFDYTLPTLFDDHPTLSRLLRIQDDNVDLLVADVEFRVQEREISGTIAIVFAGGCVRQLLTRLLEPAEAA